MFLLMTGTTASAPTSILRNVERGPFVSGPHRPGWGADQRDAKHPGTLEKPFSTVSAQLSSAPATGECRVAPAAHAGPAKSGAPDGTRTHTGAGLSRLPLPIGLRG